MEQHKADEAEKSKKKPQEDINLEDIQINTPEEASTYNAYLKWIRHSPWRKMLMWEIKKKMKILDNQIHNDFTWNANDKVYTMNDLRKKEYLMWEILSEMPDNLMAQIDLVITGWTLTNQ